MSDQDEALTEMAITALDEVRQARDEFQHQAEVWKVEARRFEQERDDLREALEDCLSMTQEIAETHLRSYIAKRCMDALANLNKTDGE